MKNSTRILLLASLCLSTINLFCDSKYNPSIKIVCTSALIPKNYEERKEQYIRAFSLLKEHGCDPYLVESVASGPTFLDECCNHVCYTHNNDPSLKNYGINEAVSLQIGFQQFNFNPDDMIIKITGRYPLENDEFFRIVEKNLDADAVVRVWDEEFACTGLFAIRLKYFLDFLNSLDHKSMEEEMIMVERFFAQYLAKIKKEGAKIVYLKRMYEGVWVPPQYLPER